MNQDCSKTAFLMSDTSCPRDAFYVSHSLIKQHPGEQDGAHVNFVCARETTPVCEGERDCVCVCDREIFAV